MEIVRRKISELRVDPQNLRHHGVENIEMLKKSLNESGQYKPLIVDKNSNVVMIGNGRLTAMKQLGWEEADCVMVDFSEHPGMEVLDNRLNELSRWDDAKIDDWLINDKGLQWWGVDASSAATLLKKSKKTDTATKKPQDAVAPAPKEKKAVPLCPCCGKPLHKVKPTFL